MCNRDDMSFLFLIFWKFVSMLPNELDLEEFSWRENIWLYTVYTVMSTMWSAHNLVQNVNVWRRIHFLR